MLFKIEAIKFLLGITENVPLTEKLMARSLKIAFFPAKASSRAVSLFEKKLKYSLLKSGAQILDFNEIVQKDSSGKERIQGGVVVFYSNCNKYNKMPMDYVGSLSNNPIIKIVLEDEKLEIDKLAYNQQMTHGLKLFTKHMCHLVISINRLGWKSFSYNGFSERVLFGANFDLQVLNKLIPKLATRVMPLKLNEFRLIKDEKDFVSNPYVKPFLRDLVKGGRLLAHTNLFYSVRNVDKFNYTKLLYRRIASKYLDERTGMSYGYIARQLPIVLPKIISSRHLLRGLCEIRRGVFIDKNKDIYLSFVFGKKTYFINVPEVWTLMSRSGSNKTNLDPLKDVLMVGLVKGVLVLRVPNSIDLESNYRPSYDTRLILAHSLANVLYGAILKSFSDSSRFVAMMEGMGAGMVHWHGAIAEEFVPRGWYIYGENNPPVLCSSPQSAIYAFLGKEKSVLAAISGKTEFIGDVHIEPQHGLNIVGPSLKRLSHFLYSSSLIS